MLKLAVPKTVKFWVTNKEPVIVESLKEEEAPTVKLPVIIAFPLAVILFPINSLPLTVKFPVLVKDNKVEEPEIIWKDVAPIPTEAVTDPVYNLVKSKPTTDEEGTLVKPDPFPWNEPENDPDPIPENEPVDNPWNDPLNEPEPIPVNEPVKDPVVLLTPIKEPLTVVAVTLEPLSIVNKLT